MVADFLKGLSYFLIGFKLIKERSLLRFVWVPLFCNIILFILLLLFAGYGLNFFSQWVEQFLPHWLQWLRWLIWILSILFSAIVLVYLSTIIVNIVAGPFNSLLSEKVIAFLKIKDNPSNTSLLQAIPVSIARQVSFIGYYLPRAVFYIVLFIIPIVQIFAAFLWFLFNGWVFTMQYLDYPMDNHGISIKEMRASMKSKPAVSLGFGCGVVLFSMIPFLNFVIVPVAVVGATVLWIKEFSATRSAA